MGKNDITNLQNTKGKPQIDKTKHLNEAYKFGKTIYSEKIGFNEEIHFMNDWFTVEKIDSQTFAISEYKHWEETHCYLLCGNDRQF